MRNAHRKKGAAGVNIKDTLRRDWEFGLKPYSESFVMWLACAGAVGLLCGAVGAAFYHLVAWATAVREARPWLLYLLPLGGLAIVLCYRAAGMSTDRGTNAVLESAQAGRRAPLRLTPLIILATTVTHLLGGSAGREGAALQIGGSMGGWLGEKLRLDAHSRRAMVLAGMSAVFSALFGTPLTAAVFSIEVICVGVIYHSALLPCALASLTAYGAAALLGAQPVRFAVPGLAELTFANAWRALLLGVGCAVVGILFCAAMHAASHLYEKKLPNQYLRVLVGSALVILFTLGCEWLGLGGRAYNGAGVETLTAALGQGALPHPAAFLLKTALTALTLGCGFRGGEIVPTFFVGACFGCLAGPLLGLDPTLAAALGLVATFCAVTNCPIASIFLGAELFGAQALGLYLLVSAVSYLLSGNYSLYSSQMTLGPKLTNQPKGKPVDSRCH